MQEPKPLPPPSRKAVLKTILVSAREVVQYASNPPKGTSFVDLISTLGYELRKIELAIGELYEMGEEDDKEGTS